MVKPVVINLIKTTLIYAVIGYAVGYMVVQLLNTYAPSLAAPHMDILNLFPLALAILLYIVGAVEVVTGAKRKKKDAPSQTDRLDAARRIPTFESSRATRFESPSRNNHIEPPRSYTFKQHKKE